MRLFNSKNEITDNRLLKSAGLIGNVEVEDTLGENEGGLYGIASPSGFYIGTQVWPYCLEKTNASDYA